MDTAAVLEQLLAYNKILSEEKAALETESFGDRQRLDYHYTSDSQR